LSSAALLRLLSCIGPSLFCFFCCFTSNHLPAYESSSLSSLSSRLRIRAFPFSLNLVQADTCKGAENANARCTFGEQDAFVCTVAERA